MKAYRFLSVLLLLAGVAPAQELSILQPTDYESLAGEAALSLAEPMAAALLRLTQDLSFDPKDPMDRNDVGWIYLRYGRLPEARKEFTAARMLGPGRFEPVLNLAVVEAKSGRVQEAEKLFKEAARSAPERWEPWANLGLLAWEKEDVSEALAAFEKASKLSADAPALWNNLGCARHRAGDFSGALAAFRRAARLGALWSDVYSNWAVAAYTAGEIDEAEQAAQKALKLNPRHAGAWNTLGLCALAQDRLTQASVAFAKAVEAAPEKWMYWVNLAHTRLKAGNLAEAQKAFERISTDDRKRLSTRRLKADLLLHRNQPQEAAEVYRELEKDQGLFSAPFVLNYGVALQRSGRLEEAVQVWEKGRRLFPDDAEITAALVQSYLASRRFSKAGEFADEGVRRFPHEARWWRWRGEARWKMGKKDDVLRDWKKAYQLGDRDAAFVERLRLLEKGEDFSRGNAEVERMIAEGKSGEAVRTAQEALKKSETPEAYDAFLSALRASGETEEYFKVLRRKQAKFGENLRDWLEAGAFAAEKSRWKDAENAYRKAERLSPEAEEVLLGLGVSLYRQYRWDEAQKYWEKGYKRYPQRAAFAYNLGKLHFDFGRPAQARFYMEKAVQLDPQNPECWLNAGALDLNEGKLAEAEKKFQKAMVLDAEFAELYFNLGDLEQKRGNYGKALEYYHEGFKRAPEDPEGYFHLGVAYWKQGKLREAAKALYRCVELNPRHADAYYNLGLVALEDDRYGAAEKFFQESLKEKGQQADAWIGLGLAAFQRGEYEKALTWFEKAKDFPKFSALAWYQEGRTRAVLGDLGSAELAYRKALNIQPNLPHAQLALGVLLADQNRRDEAEEWLQRAAGQGEYAAVREEARRRLKKL